MSLLIIGHRGNPAEYPDNTIPSILSAIKCGADAVEVDVHLTEDGELVVFHDDSLVRLTGKFTPIKQMAYEEIKNETRRIYERQCTENCYAPVLEEVIDRVKDSGETRLVVEIKKGEASYPGIGDKVVNTLQRKEMLDKCIVTSFDLFTIQKIREKHPFMNAAYLPRIFDVKYMLGVVKRLGLHSIHLPASARGIETGTALSRNDVKVFYYVVNDEDTLRTCLASGASGIFTDNPCFIKRIRDRV